MVPIFHVFSNSLPCKYSDSLIFFLLVAIFLLSHFFSLFLYYILLSTPLSSAKNITPTYFLIFWNRIHVCACLFVQKFSAKHSFPIPHALIIVHPGNPSREHFPCYLVSLWDSKSRPWGRTFVLLFAVSTTLSGFQAPQK